MAEVDDQRTRPVNEVLDDEYKAAIGGSLAELEHEVEGLINEMSEFVHDQGDENSNTKQSGSPTRIRLDLLVHKIKKLRVDLDT